jgi:hypothetical protein
MVGLTGERTPLLYFGRNVTWIFVFNHDFSLVSTKY